MLRALLILTVSIFPHLAQPSAANRPTSSQPVESEGQPAAPLLRRIVRQFDFDERAIGNFERIPMHWYPVVREGFPRYLESVFDDRVGHDSPPSFHLALEGGNIGSEYLAQDIEVNPASDYQIVAYILPSQLVNARARLAACFLDATMRPILQSQRHSEPVRGDESNGWTRVQIELPGGIPAARWISLACLVEQPFPAGPSDEQPHPIQRRDARGAAWFDDISIYRLPRTSLALSTPDLDSTGNVFAFDETIRCRAAVVDPDGLGLKSTLQITDADGRPCADFPVATIPGEQDAACVPLDGLPPGAYLARLTVQTGFQELIRREQPFVRLGPKIRPAASATGPIGIILNDLDPDHYAENGRLVCLSAAGMLKIPMWSRRTTDQHIVFGDSGLNHFLDRLGRCGIQSVAVLEAPPPTLARRFAPGHRTLIDILSEPPAKWRPYLALPLAQLGSRIRLWQLGEDGADGVADAARLQHARANLEAELSPLVSKPAIITQQTGDAAPTDSATTRPANVELEEAPRLLHIPDSVPSIRIADYVSSAIAGRSPFWAVIDAPRPGAYRRSTQLCEFARRIVTALGAGAQCVFLHQPWSFQDADGACRPSEELAILHTLADALAGLTPSPVWIAPDTVATLFSDPAQSTGVLVAWTEGDAGQPRNLSLPLGEAVRRIDLWGNTSDIGRDSSGSAITIDATPALFAPVNPWQVRMQAGFAREPIDLAPALAEQIRNLHVVNPRTGRLRGRLRVITPPGLSMTPKAFAIDLDGGQSLDYPVQFRVPTNFPIGDYVLEGRLHCEQDPPLELVLRAPLSVRSAGLDVSVLTAPDNGGLRILQRITNRTERPVTLRSSLVAPHRPRTSRLIRDLECGQSTTRTYALTAAEIDAMHGGFVRVSVEQLDGPLIHNQIIELR